MTQQGGSSPGQLLGDAWAVCRLADHGNPAGKQRGDRGVRGLWEFKALWVLTMAGLTQEPCGRDGARWERRPELWSKSAVSCKDGSRTHVRCSMGWSLRMVHSTASSLPTRVTLPFLMPQRQKSASSQKSRRRKYRMVAKVFSSRGLYPQGEQGGAGFISLPGHCRATRVAGHVFMCACVYLQCRQLLCAVPIST